MTPADIRALRLSLGLSTKAFGQAIGLAPTNGGRTVRRWEAGTSIPNGLAMAALIELRDKS